MCGLGFTVVTISSRFHRLNRKEPANVSLLILTDCLVEERQTNDVCNKPILCKYLAHAFFAEKEIFLVEEFLDFFHNQSRFLESLPSLLPCKKITVL